MVSNAKFQFAIDRGGTFTDIYARCPGGKIRLMKLLSVDPSNYQDAPREGIRRILEEEIGVPMPITEPIDEKYIDWIRMGTTVATNALLERKGERMALIINKGFKDLLFIGNQARPKIFDLKIETPQVLYEEVVEVDCRVVPALTNRCLLKNLGGEWAKWKQVTGTTGEVLYVCQELNEDEVKNKLVKLKEKGFNSIAVVLMHSYMYPEQEKAVGLIGKSLGFDHISLSHEVMPMVRIIPRGFTACADAYLTPHIKKYVSGFASGFKNNLSGVNVLFMQSDGGLAPMEIFNGSRAILSGPAGGVVGYAVTTYKKETDLPVIGFDMGGTSTDVSRFSGNYEHVFESTTAGVTIQAPQLDVNTVAAGGGSVLFFRSGLFVVGPESAGAHPGPVCYRKGGPLTVTDANLCLGRLLPDYFPKIFGPTENEPLDKNATTQAFKTLTQDINNFLSKQIDKSQNQMTVEEVAMGFIRVANEAMCRPIRALTQAKGYDTSHHVLACFGGAGGQHACSIARSLGMKTVFVHKYAGILSAYGMALADVVKETQEPCSKIYEPDSFPYLDERLTELSTQCRTELESQGFELDQIHTEAYLHLRYEGTDCGLMCTASPATKEKLACKHGDFETTFLEKYRCEFGFTIEGRTILVDDIRVRGVGKCFTHADPPTPSAEEPPKIDKVTEVYFENGLHSTSVYLLKELKSGHMIPGPAIIMDNLSTILVEPDCSATITRGGDVKIEIGSGLLKRIGTELDPIQLSIFSHRFMSIAEQMGRILQRTSISTNIKERLDFSCALFGPDGGLVSNAPHIPVHLGSMQEAVQYQMKSLKGGFEEGDVILTNHPGAGGSHLPDLTVITPVFYKNHNKPVFFVASRGHHADIGGITPGSMPPHSKILIEEGASFKSFYLVKKGIFNEKELVEALMAPGKIPGSSGTRNLQDNLSDLNAQIAANHKGINLVCELIDTYGLDVVQAYMDHIQTNAEVAVRDMLRDIGTNIFQFSGKSQLYAQDFMDDGSPICLKIDINIQEGTAVCDFTGTGYEVWGNCNAPRAITLSALIYCLRCMVGRDVPLNQGCLNPIKVIIPKGCLLDPSDTAAVVGGNVLTSQRIVDVVLKAFEVCAASQGCMNNITFGEEKWGYYETVAGGSGAGPSWHGHSGIHTHMTNTRITDAEILEHRYPIILRRFSLRPESGGNGRYRGGDGIIRELIFRRHMMLSVLTERRVFHPYGMNGGYSGERGLNLMQKVDGRIVSLGSKTAINVEPGDVFILQTPGGGGYGSPENGTCIEEAGSRSQSQTFIERGSVFEYNRAQESV
ncbi:hypothetical protein L9F63_016531 [Diploptera punctata]|uniref:5-oxoprolinase n=1 Tax=Diploptera punctata TaxID=6984 RepID=A0AAD8EHT9_DIPPU|nr:hypothetical protein L9F63_016531 [Diploptera punctata]